MCTTHISSNNVINKSITYFYDENNKYEFYDALYVMNLLLFPRKNNGASYRNHR